MSPALPILLVFGGLLAGLVIGTAWTLKKHRVGLVLCLLLPCAARAQGSAFAVRKGAHFGGGAFIAWQFGSIGKTPRQAFIIGLAAGAAAGVGKEAFDGRTAGETYASRRRDVLITAAGAALGAYLIRHQMQRRVEFATAPPPILPAGQ